jgi:hypothetical protein
MKDTMSTLDEAVPGVIRGRTSLSKVPCLQFVQGRKLSSNIESGLYGG